MLKTGAYIILVIAFVTGVQIRLTRYKKERTSKNLLELMGISAMLVCSFILLIGRFV